MFILIHKDEVGRNLSLNRGWVAITASRLCFGIIIDHGQLGLKNIDGFFLLLSRWLRLHLVWFATEKRFEEFHIYKGVEFFNDDGGCELRLRGSCSS